MNSSENQGYGNPGFLSHPTDIWQISIGRNIGVALGEEYFFSPLFCMYRVFEKYCSLRKVFLTLLLIAIRMIKSTSKATVYVLQCLLHLPCKIFSLSSLLKTMYV